jgi:hypothetical protein
VPEPVVEARLSAAEGAAFMTLLERLDVDGQLALAAPC